MVADAITEIVGKEIASIVVKEGERPDWQVFLLFTDGTSYELNGFGGLACAKGLGRQGLEEVRTYMDERQKVVLEVTGPKRLDPELREKIRQGFSSGVAYVFRMVAPNPDGGLVSLKYLEALEEIWARRGLEPCEIDDDHYAWFCGLTDLDVETIAEHILGDARGIVEEIFSAGFSSEIADRLLERYVESMLYLVAIGIVGFRDDGTLFSGPTTGAPPVPLREQLIVKKIRQVLGRVDALWLSVREGVN